MNVFRVVDSAYMPNYATNQLGNSGCGCLAYGTFTPTSDGTTPIGNSAFQGCGGITAIDFSNFLLPIQSSSIGSNAFRSCMGISSYTFKNTQEYTSNFTIGDDAFRSCALLGKVISNTIDVAKGLLPLMINASGNPA